MEAFELLEKSEDSGINQTAISVIKEVTKNSDLEVNKKLMQASILKAFSNMVHKDSNVRPYEFKSSKAAEMINQSILRGHVYSEKGAFK